MRIQLADRRFYHVKLLSRCDPREVELLVLLGVVLWGSKVTEPYLHQPGPQRRGSSLRGLCERLQALPRLRPAASRVRTYTTGLYTHTHTHTQGIDAQTSVS